MAETSQLLYRCPYCERIDRDESAVRDHISAAKSGGHSGVNGHSPDVQVELLQPDLEAVPIDQWRGELFQYIENEYDPEEFINEPEEGQPVEYIEVAETLGIPKSFIAFELTQTDRYVPVNQRGRTASRFPSGWDDLSDKIQHTLLARAYFPDRTHEEIAAMPYSGHDYQGSVSQHLRQYTWMFSHPDVPTPVEPSNGEDEREVEFEIDVDKAIEDLERVVPGDDGDDEEASEPDAEPPTDFLVPEPTDEEEPAHEPTDATRAYATLGTDMAYEAMCAFIETSRYEEARILFEGVAEDGVTDVRWEVDE